MHQKKFSILLVALIAISLFAWVQPAYATVTWTYNAGTNTATASGAGSTNFAALVAADAAGGWGKFTADATGTQIICAGKIIIGDNTNACVFTDTNKQIVFLSGVAAAYASLIMVKTNSIFTLGTLENATDKTTSSGCAIINLSTTNNIMLIDCQNGGYGAGGNYKLYSCQIIGTAHQSLRSYTTGGNCKAYNCLLIKTQFRITDPEIYNCQLQKYTQSFDGAVFGLSGTMDKLFVTTCLTAIVHYAAYNFSVSNSILRNNNYVVHSYGPATGDDYLINFDVDNWAFLWNDANTNKIYRQYTLDLTVLNGDITDIVENANVTLTKNGTQIFTELTDSEGAIATKTLTYGYYQQSTGDTLQGGADPFILTITHPDWANYTSRFYVTEKTNLIVSMQEITPDAAQTVTNNFGAFILVGIIGFILVLIIIKRRRA